MPSATAGGLPYPLPAEPVRDGANAIKLLAEAIDHRGAAMDIQSASKWYTPASGVTPIFWNRPFKAGTIPTVVFCPVMMAGQDFYPVVAMMRNPDLNGVEVKVREVKGGSDWGGALIIHWIAIGPMA